MTDFKWDLVRPCKHCPFRTDETRIKFRGRARAEEIEEGAYRNGFVYHLTGELDDDGGLHFKSDGMSQHCAGALIMLLRGGSGSVPFEWLDEDEQNRITSRLDWLAPVFDDPEDFFQAQEDE